MTLTRRRFLTISAAFSAVPATAKAHSWQGRAFGADVSLTIRGPRSDAAAAMTHARKLIAEVEQLFSLYDPTSSLSQLNAKGVLRLPTARFLELMQAADTAFRLTDGLFDPTVQPLWQALAQDRDTAAAVASIGWKKLRFDPAQITLGPAQALTFNGIAQGFATDLVADALTARGLTNTLVNIGEYRANGGRWTVGIADPEHGILGHRTLTKGAIATSSPAASPIRAQGHILHANAQPRWSTVTVEASSATLADSLSTAMVLATREQIDVMKARADIARVALVDFNGDLFTV
ncbi:FAD:protein FMN transferase (plasmid) [Sulfitobacter sp. S223]|uniref:FAD:protein FMN transferase n=1 Tax=Sulfitobacter sp. S223 TaxID=2867023 RepID=UPI0021A80D25|nr:FAD:protein FMN transferase [Sulfitobacter sp. S223]UWR28273.1 FAD:protein FMN transferase [Sulfitobacter sp. S223]